MKSFPLFLLVVLSLCANVQSQRLGLVLDSTTKEPVEFVDVFNKFDQTMTNSDGSFFILTQVDSVQFQKIGYKVLRLPPAEIRDTIYLSPKALELDGVTVTNMKSLWDKVRDSAASNYILKPYKERFLLRCLLRKNGQIMRLQDIAGKLSRKTLIYTRDIQIDKKDFQFEIEHMRKIGLVKDENGVVFSFFSLSELLFETIRLNATGEGFIVKEILFENEPYSKIYIADDGNQPMVKTTGEYIINDKNNALEFVSLTSKMDLEDFGKRGPILFRNISRHQTAIFIKKEKQKKYFINSAKLIIEIEVKDIKNTFSDIYECEYILNTFGNNEDFSFRPNVNHKKDIFKLKFNYDASFWDNQKKLPLTQEMKAFIKSLNGKKK